MNEIIKNKKIVIIVAVIIFAFVIYSYLFKKDIDTQLITSESISSQAQQFGAGKEIVALLSDLKSLQLNDDIFNNAAFKSLEDFSLPISNEPKGRNNPFAPIGLDIGTTEAPSESVE